MRRWSVSLRSVTQMIVRGSHAETGSDTYRPTPAHLAHWRGRDRVSRHNSTPGPTGVKCAGESRGHGRDSRRGAWSRQISHIISHGHFSRPYENVAIPTIQLQYLNKSLGNYVRNCSDGGKTPAKQISHAIRLEQISTNPENVAIPTMQIQCLNKLLGNCMRNWGAQQRCARGPRQGPRAVAGPGRSLRRRAEQHISDQAPPVWRAPEGPEGQAAVPVGGGGAWPGFETTRRAKLAARTARGRAAAHGHTKQPGPAGSRVRQRGGYRSTRPLSAHSATASSRLRPNDRQSWRRRRIHRNMPPTTAAPRPAPPIRPSKPVRASPCFGLVAGTSGAT